MGLGVFLSLVSQSRKMVVGCNALSGWGVLGAEGWGVDGGTALPGWQVARHCHIIGKSWISLGSLVEGGSAVFSDIAHPTRLWLLQG